jgi:serine/threonine-protein kinase
VPAAEASSSLLGIALEDRYRIVREIGRGGMGAVYEAEHVELGKRVAVKVMLEKYADDADAVARFRREALAASRIGHKNICDVHHIGQTPDGRLFVVMELLTGQPLGTALHHVGQMPVYRSIHIMRQVLRAIGAAHVKGIVHRDLKPDNVFIVDDDDRKDVVKLLDFGISKMLDSPDEVAATRLTSTGMVMGTPLYMAPEQAMGADVDRRADIYACGVMLYELLAGRPPFEGANYTILIAKVLTTDAARLDTVRSGLPPALVAAVHRALDKDPNRRFATAEEFAAALPPDRLPSELELAGTVGPSSSSIAAFANAKRSRAPLYVGAAVAVLAAAAVTAIVLHGSGGSNEPTTKASGATTTQAGSASEIVAPPPPPPPPAPKPTGGKLYIKSDPPAGIVTVDGKLAGTAPIEVDRPAGVHKVHVEVHAANGLSGQRDEEVEVRDGERATIVIAVEVYAAKGQNKVKVVRQPPQIEKTPRSGSATVAPPPPQPPQQPLTPYDDPPQQQPKKPPNTNPNGPKPNPYQ